MNNIETPIKLPEVNQETIEETLHRLEKYTKDSAKDDPTNELTEAQGLLVQAEELGIEVKEFKEKIIEIAANFFDRRINELFGQLEEKLKEKKPECYLLFTQASQLLENAKKFKVDMPEEHTKLAQLERSIRDTIKL